MSADGKPVRVTVMIPTYNQAGFLRQAIESALAQTYPQLEVIVGDDASTDDTAQVVGGIADPRLRYVRNPANLGRTGNYRALLYEHASGDYVVNLDGDDFFTDPDFVADAVKLAAGEPEVVMVVAQVVTQAPDGAHVSALPACTQLTGMEILRHLPDPAYLMMHLGVLYARQPAMAIDFYRSSAISSDWESLYRLGLRGRVRYLPRPVGVWRLHGGNETGTRNHQKLLENYAIWQPVFQDAMRLGMPRWRAELLRARTISFILYGNLSVLSQAGNRALAHFLARFFRMYTLAFCFMAVHPRHLARLLASFLGFFRRGTS